MSLFTASCDCSASRRLRSPAAARSPRPILAVLILPNYGPVEERFGDGQCFAIAMALGHELLLGAISMRHKSIGDVVSLRERQGLQAAHPSAPTRQNLQPFRPQRDAIAPGPDAMFTGITPNKFHFVRWASTQQLALSDIRSACIDESCEHRNRGMRGVERFRQQGRISDVVVNHAVAESARGHPAFAGGSQQAKPGGTVEVVKRAADGFADALQQNR